MTVVLFTCLAAFLFGVLVSLSWAEVWEDGQALSIRVGVTIFLLIATFIGIGYITENGVVGSLEEASKEHEEVKDD